MAAEAKRKIGEMSDAEVRRLVTDGDHIWLNAFAIIHPTDDFLITLGRTVVQKVQQSDIVDDFVGLSPVAVIRVNAS